ncbi:hypothetical protein DFQ26_004377 [Actinomortierella ambigua]|nr:hypothetical protein DFQ26_004377 [Actinomortierella ambigua]
MATWISNFLAKLYLDRSAEHFILEVLYNNTLTEEEKSASIFDFFEQSGKSANVNLQDAVSELFAQYQRNGLYMLVAREYYPPVQPQPQRPSTQLRPPVKEFVPRSVSVLASEQRRDEASEDDAEIYGVDPTKAKAGESPQGSGDAWARIDDDDDGSKGDQGEGGGGLANDCEVFRVPTSQIYGDHGEEEEGEEYGDYEAEDYEDEDYYGEDGYNLQYHQGQEQGWIEDPDEHDEFDPFAPPSADDMHVLQSVQGYSPFAGYAPPTMPNQNASEPYEGYYNPYDSQYQYQYQYQHPYGEQQEQQQQQQQAETQDMTPLEMLQQILADMKPEQIEQAFEENGHDMDAALSAIIAKRQLVAAGSHQQQATAASAGGVVVDPLQQFIPKGDPRATQTCRFFLQGKCFRKDCWYSHDLDAMVCRFWLKGECFKGASCEFSHGLDAGKLTEVVEVEPVKQQALPSMDEWDFPSLSSPAKPAKSKKGGNKCNGGPAASSQVSKPTTTTATSDTSNDSAVDSLAKDLTNKAHISGAPPSTTSATPKPLTLSYSATASKAASKPLTRLRSSRGHDDPDGNSSSPSSSSASSSQHPRFNLSLAPSSVPWLETGSTLNQQYLKARKRASEYAAARNRCFEMATQAYLRNDGATASRYSAEGRQYNEKMMATHREASQQIFTTRNARTTTTTKGGSDSSNSGGVQRNETWIDLHGLHVEESLVFLDQFMEKLENEVYTGVVYVVTGTGHHSTLGLAKVRRAVLEWLADWGYLHKEISVDGVHGGLVAVQVIKGRA